MQRKRQNYAGVIDRILDCNIHWDTNRIIIDDVVDRAATDENCIPGTVTTFEANTFRFMALYRYDNVTCFKRQHALPTGFIHWRDNHARLYHWSDYEALHQLHNCCYYVLIRYNASEATVSPLARSGSGVARVSLWARLPLDLWL